MTGWEDIVEQKEKRGHPESSQLRSDSVDWTGHATGGPCSDLRLRLCQGMERISPRPKHGRETWPEEVRLVARDGSVLREIGFGGSLKFSIRKRRGRNGYCQSCDNNSHILGESYQT